MVKSLSSTAGIDLDIQGVEEVLERLSYINDAVRNRIERRALGRATAVLAKYIRKRIPKNIEPKFDGPKKGIGSRPLKKGESSVPMAKAGIGVGRALSRALDVMYRRGRKGVGIGARNLHWFAIGTTDRFTGSRTYSIRTKRGTAKTKAKSYADRKGRRTVLTGNVRKFTGRIVKSKWGGFVESGAMAGRSEAFGECIKAIRAGIEAAALKRPEDVGEGALE